MNTEAAVVGRWTDHDRAEIDNIFAHCCFFSTFGSTFLDFWFPSSIIYTCSHDYIDQMVIVQYSEVNADI